MKTITLTNDFHNTEARIRPREDGTISRATERRAWRKLCGMTDCTCGGPGGVRGGEYSLRRQSGSYRVMRRAWNEEYAVHHDVPVGSGETPAHCECGEVTGVHCEWEGPKPETVVVEYMPKDLRASHEAAGNRGVYPHNGAKRIRMERSCAALVIETEDGWAEIVEERSV